MKSVSELRGRAVPAYHGVGRPRPQLQGRGARSTPDKCIGCQLCYVACRDGAHQCIHMPGRTEAESRAAGHTHVPKDVPRPRRDGARRSPAPASRGSTRPSASAATCARSSARCRAASRWRSATGRAVRDLERPRREGHATTCPAASTRLSARGRKRRSDLAGARDGRARAKARSTAGRLRDAKKN